MKYYCGLDISLNTTAICVVNQNGDIIREGEVATEPVAIEAWFKRLDFPLERVGLEAGNLTPWLSHELLAAGWPAICIETRHAKAAMSAQQVKTDRNDARGIAHLMRTGWYRKVHVRSHESQKLRVLLNNRRCLVDKRREIDSQIRGTLKVFGLKVGKVTRQRYDARITEGAHELFAHDGNVRAGLFEIGLRLRRDRKGAHVDGLGQLIDVLRKAALAKLAECASEQFGIAHARLAALHIVRRTIEEDGLDVCPEGHISGHLVQRSTLFEGQAQREWRLALLLRRASGYLIECIPICAHHRTSDHCPELRC